MSSFADTIFALSSGSLPSGVAVVRLSGPGVRDALLDVAGSVPPARRAVLRTFRDGKRVLDQGLALYFPGPASFTGEDCAELHLHGGRATVDAMLEVLGARAGCHMAEAGEFTRRAFLHGKLDLTGAEALADLISAETEAQRRLALENASGRQRDAYVEIRRRLLAARALIEADLDFSDEGDVPAELLESVHAECRGVIAELEGQLASYKAAEIVREGYRVSIVGPPNAGKSSLLNALAQREAAIVSDVAGTTRDLIEVSLDLGGLKVILTDTAGLRSATDDPVEAIGMQRTRDAAMRSDLLLLLSDIREPEFINPPGDAPTLRVRTKMDLLAQSAAVGPEIAISTLTGSGLGKLIDAIRQHAEAAADYRSAVVPSRLRHVVLLRQAARHLDAVTKPLLPELLAEELRLASDCLSALTGTIGVEDVLDSIFSQFCIGK